MTPHRTTPAALALTFGLSLIANAQTPASPQPAKAPETPKASEAPATSNARPSYGPMTTRVFMLKNIVQMQDGNEILGTLRNTIDPRDRLTYAPSQNVIIMDAPVEELAKAEKIIDALDKPKRLYRLTYTLIDLDGAKRVGDQHYSMVVVAGQRAVLKQGNKVPIFTGEYVDKISTTNQQITYLDVGMNFDATLDDALNSLRLKTKVEQSSVIEDHAGATAAQDPVLRQALFEGSAMLSPGKPMTIGTLDITGTTRRIEIQATAEPINP